MDGGALFYIAARKLCHIGLKSILEEHIFFHVLYTLYQTPHLKTLRSYEAKFELASQFSMALVLADPRARCPWLIACTVFAFLQVIFDEIFYLIVHRLLPVKDDSD